MPQQSFVPFVVGWAALAVGSTVALRLVRDPAIKRAAQRALVVFSGVLFLGAVWYFDGSARNITLAGAVVAVAVVANFLLVRVCDSCAALIHPRYFVPPKFCSKCGAPLM